MIKLNESLPQTKQANVGNTETLYIWTQLNCRHIEQISKYQESTVYTSSKILKPSTNISKLSRVDIIYSLTRWPCATRALKNSAKNLIFLENLWQVLKFFWQLSEEATRGEACFEKFGDLFIATRQIIVHGNQVSSVLWNQCKILIFRHDYASHSICVKYDHDLSVLGTDYFDFYAKLNHKM